MSRPSSTTEALTHDAPEEETPTAAEVKRVISRIPIRFYQAAWCPHCRRAKAWFAAQDLNVTEYDVDHDSQAKQEMTTFDARGGLPTIVVADRVLVGFSEAEVTRTLAAEASKRLRATVRVKPAH